MMVCRLLCLLVFLTLTVPALGAPPAAGDRLADLILPTPRDPGAREQLGLQDRETFTLSDLKADLILLEVVGIYCPFCVKQVPGFRNLYGRLNKGRLKGRVAMVALAAGATDAEVRKFVSTGQYLYPVLSDCDYIAHKQLGEPLTPFTMICRPDGTILYAHLGVIDDIDGLYRQIKGFLE